MAKQYALIKRSDIDLIWQIADRAVAVATQAPRTVTDVPARHRVFLYVAKAHRHKPLDLEALLRADLTNFTHDVFGIMRHLDMTSGQMRDCFVPRFALKQQEVAS